MPKNAQHGDKLAPHAILFTYFETHPKHHRIPNLSTQNDMATRTEERGRITARAPQPVVDELEEAAALVGVTVNQFIVQAATEKARTIIDSYTRIELSRRDATFIANLLDNPPAPNEALKRADQHYKKAVENGDPDSAASESPRH